MFDPQKFADDIALGRVEESISLELKSHLRCPDPDYYKKLTNDVYKYIVDKEVFGNEDLLQKYFIFCNLIKPVAAFLNSQGGVLSIGFEDKKDGEGRRSATGLIDKVQVSQDQFSLTITDALESKFGRVICSHYLEYFFEPIGKKEVCLIKVKPYDGPGHCVFVQPYKKSKSDDPRETLYVRNKNRSDAITSPKALFEHGWEKGAMGARGNSAPAPRPAPPAQPPTSNPPNAGWRGPFEWIDWGTFDGCVVVLLPAMKPVKCKIGGVEDLKYQLGNAEGPELFLKSAGKLKLEDGWFYQIKFSGKSFERDSAIDVDPSFDEQLGLYLKVLKEQVCPPRTVRSYWDVQIIKFTTERGDYYALPNADDYNNGDMRIGEATGVQGFPKYFEDLIFLQNSERFFKI